MSPRKSIIALLTLSVLILLSAPAVMAQNIVTGDLIGTVTDQTGAVVSGANVTLKSGETATSQSTTTNQTGVYHFALLKPGNYTVAASAANMSEISRKVIIAVGQVTNASIQLGVTGGKEVIEVTAEPPLLQTKRQHHDDLQHQAD